MLEVLLRGMIINWYGEGCFKIQTGGLILVSDPFESKIGLTPPRGKFDVVLKTLIPWTSAPGQPINESFVIHGPGEYEIKGIAVQGFPLVKESSEKFSKTVYKVNVENLTLGFLGHLSEELSAEAFEALTDSNILFLPAGGKPFINQEKLTKLIKQLKPKIVVASFFKIPKLKRVTSDWKKLANEMGQKPEVMEKLTVRKKEVGEQKGTKLVILKI